MDKQWTLEKLIGKELVAWLFVEHYVNLIGRTKQAVDLGGGLILDDVME